MPTSSQCVGSSDAGSFRFIQWRDYLGANKNQVPCFLAVERQKDSSGIAVGASYQVTWFCSAPDSNLSGGGGGNNFQMWRSQTCVNGVGWMRLEPAPLALQTGLSSFAQNGNGGAIPLVFVYGQLYGFSLDLLVGKQQDFPDGQTAVLNHFGSSHTFYVVSCWQQNSTFGNIGCISTCPLGANQQPGNMGGNCLLFRYE